MEITFEAEQMKNANPLIVLMRTTLLTFMARFMRHLGTSHLCLSSSLFLSGFLHFLSEETLTEMIVILLSFAMATLQVPVSHADMNWLVDNIRRVMESCEGHADEPACQNIGYCLVNAIDIVLPHNLALAPAFSPFLLSLLRLTHLFPNPCVYCQ
jgi:hypothetical protein